MTTLAPDKILKFPSVGGNGSKGSGWLCQYFWKHQANESQKKQGQLQSPRLCAAKRCIMVRDKGPIPTI